MSKLPVHIQYSLDRWRHFRLHVGYWSWRGPVRVVVLLLLTAGAMIEDSLWLCLAAVWAMWRVLGMAIILMKREQQFDIAIEPLGIGCLHGSERWYSHLDGIHPLRQVTPDTWSISHRNGTLVHVPAELLPPPPHCVEHLQESAARGWDYLQPFADARKRELELAD
jgi:hypothetical protein